MEEALRTILTGDASVSALAAGGVTWGEYPQGAQFPGVVMNVISGASGHNLDGPDDLFSGRVQVDCYALTYGASKALSRAVVDALDGYQIPPFQGVFWEVMRDMPRDTYSDAAERPFRVSIDFMVMANV